MAIREHSFESEGRRYTLRFSINAFLAAEEALGVGTADLQARLTSGDVRAVRALFWAGLRRHHPDLSEEDAGELMSVRDMAEILRVALGGQDADPRPAAAG